MAAPKVVIIGAGILGATIAHVLSRSQARVCLVEEKTAPGLGVTRHSFGWINHVTADPEADPTMYRRRRDASTRYERLDRALGGRLLGRRRGSLVWEASEEATERLVRRHAAHGSPTRLIGQREFARLAPLVAEPPRGAAYSPDDAALDPDATALLLRSAMESGARIILGRRAEAIHTIADRAAGVRLAGEMLEADSVVIAAGMGSARLLPGFAPRPEIAASPAALITIAADGGALGCILRGPELEIRSCGDGRLLAAAGAPSEDGEDARRSLAEVTLAGIRRMLPAIGDPRLISVGIGPRPMPAGGPLSGRLPAIPNLFLAVAHPGVILAPEIAETIADQILDRPSDGGRSPAGT